METRIRPEWSPAEIRERLTQEGQRPISHEWTDQYLLAALAQLPAPTFREATVDLLCPFRDRVHTLTLDNGTEGAEHERIAQSLGATVYFAHPYHSWERGTNENTNGLIRQYFPKCRDLSTVTRKELDHATERLNHRPRKRLGFRTPYEVFFHTRTSLTVALPT